MEANCSFMRLSRPVRGHGGLAGSLVSSSHSDRRGTLQEHITFTVQVALENKMDPAFDQHRSGSGILQIPRSSSHPMLTSSSRASINTHNAGEFQQLSSRSRLDLILSSIDCNALVHKDRKLEEGHQLLLLSSCMLAIVFFPIGMLKGELRVMTRTT